MQNYELNYTTIVLKFTKNDEPNQMEAKPEVKEFPSEGFFFLGCYRIKCLWMCSTHEHSTDIVSRAFISCSAEIKEKHITVKTYHVEIQWIDI